MSIICFYVCQSFFTILCLYIATIRIHFFVDMSKPQISTTIMKILNCLSLRHKMAKTTAKKYTISLGSHMQKLGNPRLPLKKSYWAQKKYCTISINRAATIDTHFSQFFRNFPPTKGGKCSERSRELRRRKGESLTNNKRKANCC